MSFLGSAWVLCKSSLPRPWVTADTSVLKTDVGELKTDVRELKTDVRELKTDVGKLLHHFGIVSGDNP